MEDKTEKERKRRSESFDRVVKTGKHNTALIPY